MQLPGRERRISEPGIVSIGQMADRVADGLRVVLDAPCAFFGHSMGAVLSYEVACRLRGDGCRMPAALIVSGHRAPHIPSPRSESIYRLPDREFIQELWRLDGTPSGVLENEQLLELLLPALRADFEAIETYQYAWREPLPCPIVAYGGEADAEVLRNHIEAWREHTSAAFSSHLFAGGHFYLHALRTELLAQIAQDLEHA